MLRFFASVRPSSLSGPRVRPVDFFAPFVSAAFLVLLAAFVEPLDFFVAICPPWDVGFVDRGSLAGSLGTGKRLVPLKRERECTLQIPLSVVLDTRFDHFMIKRSSAGMSPIR